MAVRERKLAFLTAAVVVLLDQLLKYLAPALGFTVIKNQGVAFGLFPNISWEIIVLLLLGLVVCFWKKPLVESSWQRFGLMMILAGGLSNFFDRLLLGHIRDFIDLKIWPAFNLADAAITIGVVTLLFKQIKTSAASRER